jgi:hypothetical protein
MELEVRTAESEKGIVYAVSKEDAAPERRSFVRIPNDSLYYGRNGKKIHSWFRILQEYESAIHNIDL